MLVRRRRARRRAAGPASSAMRLSRSRRTCWDSSLDSRASSAWNAKRARASSAIGRDASFVGHLRPYEALDGAEKGSSVRCVWSRADDGAATAGMKVDGGRFGRGRRERRRRAATRRGMRARFHFGLSTASASVSCCREGRQQGGPAALPIAQESSGGAVLLAGSGRIVAVPK